MSTTPLSSDCVPSTFNIEQFDPTIINWNRWLQRFEGALRIFKIANESKVAYMLHYIGPVSYDTLCDRLDPDDPYSQSYEQLTTLLQDIYESAPLEIVENFRFHQRKQEEGETIQQYIAALHKLSINCKMGAYLKTALRNQLVFGLSNKRIQSRLLKVKDLTLEKATQIALTMELSEKDGVQLQATESTMECLQADEKPTTKDCLDKIPSSKAKKRTSMTLATFGNVQSTQVIYENKNQQFSLAKSSEESVSLSSFSEQLPSISLANDSCTSLLRTDFPIPLSQHSLDLSSEEKDIKKEELPFNDVEEHLCVLDKHTEQFEVHFEKIVPKLEDKIIDLIDVEAVEATPFEELERIDVQQLRTQSAIPQEDTEDSQSKNPLFFLLRKNGLRCQELIDHPQRNDLTLEWRDINLIARITAKYLLNLATPPKRKILSSTLTEWAQYFKRLFPKIPMFCFYGFKYESYQRKTGITIKKKRAEGALQVQLFQERRKLIKKDRTVLLKRPSTESISNGSSSFSNVSLVTSTWRSAGQQGEKVQHRSKISTTDIDPELQHHLHFLCNQLHNKLSLQLATSWEATFNYRRKLLVNQSGTVWDYLNDFPFLKIDDIGKVLICKDFDKLYPNIDPIVNSGKLAAILDDRRLAIINTAKVIIKSGSQQKQKDVGTSFLELAERDSDVQVRVTGALLLLPFIFPRIFVERTWKPTRLDIIDSFIARVCSETNVNEYIEHRRKSLSEIKRSSKIPHSVQPYILAVGPTWEHISHVYIIVDQVLYTCESIIEATELCFKLFHAYHSDYPAESKHVWQLIQQGFYKLFLKDHDLHRRTITKALTDIGIELNTE